MGPHRHLVHCLALTLTLLIAACAPQKELVYDSVGPAIPEPSPNAGPAVIPDLVTQVSPWLRIEADSEQRQPVYLGAKPRELALGINPSHGGAVLPDFLRTLGESQVAMITTALVEAGLIGLDKRIELEAWPVRDDGGRLSWALARYRTDSGLWQWLESSILPEGTDEAPVLPFVLDPVCQNQAALIFDDMLEMRSLYDKPAYGNCVWSKEMSGSLAAVTGAWLPTDRMAQERKARRTAGEVCISLPQPARLDGRPVSFILVLENGRLLWPKEITWKRWSFSLPASKPSPPRIKSWPPRFIEDLKKDVMVLDGEREALFPLSKRKVRFTRKNNIASDNQLLEIVAYLEERYRDLGLKTYRHEFTWRSNLQANLIAVIPGSEAGSLPVLLADHIDTAFCEDTFENSGRRVSVAGADDNYLATAVLLRAAEILRRSKPRYDLILVHFTGEEFPADSLGARHFVGDLLRDRKDIRGLILMDMIGHRENSERTFQLNPGDSEASLAMASMAVDAAAANQIGFVPVVRTRFDERSYLYNTDGLIFSEAGYPVLLLNEHINRLENIYRQGYHDTTDSSANIDWQYAAAIAKTAIETTAMLADCWPKD